MLRDFLTEVFKCILGPRCCSWHGVKRFVFRCGRFAFMSVDKDNLEEPLHVYYRALGAKRVDYAGINIGAYAEPPVQLVCTVLQPPGWRTFSFSQGDNDRFWRTEWAPQTVQLVRCSHLLSIPPARPFQIYENGPLWQPPPCDKRVEESGHPVRKCSEKGNSVEILLKIHWMQPFSSFSDVWLTSCWTMLIVGNNDKRQEVPDAIQRIEMLMPSAAVLSPVCLSLCPKSLNLNW